MREKFLHPATIIATCALVVALGGTGIAVTQLARNSVGTRQLKNNAVTGAKVRDGSLSAADFRKGSLPAGQTGAQGPQGAQGSQGPQGVQGIPGPATGAAGGALAGSYPNPSLAPDALGTERAFTPTETCWPYTETAAGAGVLIYRSSGTPGFWTNAASGGLSCPVTGLPTGARITSVDVVVDDASGAANVTALLGRSDVASGLFTPWSNEAASTGSSGAQTLTLTARAGAVIDGESVYYVGVGGLTIDSLLGGFTVHYTLN